jgi:hypothetical protein
LTTTITAGFRSITWVAIITGQTVIGREGAVATTTYIVGAGIAVVTVAVLLTRFTLIGRLVTGVGITAITRWVLMTAGSTRTSIGAVTPEAIITRCRVVHKLAATGRITTVCGADFTIVASKRSTWLTITGYTCLQAITDITVVTLDIALTDLTQATDQVASFISTTVVNMVAAIGRPITAIIGTGHAVITVGRRACLTT